MTLDGGIDSSLCCPSLLECQWACWPPGTGFCTLDGPGVRVGEGPCNPTSYTIKVLQKTLNFGSNASCRTSRCNFTTMAQTPSEALWKYSILVICPICRQQILPIPAESWHLAYDARGHVLGLFLTCNTTTCAMVVCGSAYNWLLYWILTGTTGK